MRISGAPVFLKDFWRENKNYDMSYPNSKLNWLIKGRQDNSKFRKREKLIL